ncbi:MAG TPA: hypothetical protein VF266_04455 [Thermoanaerobaculia bacterium]
MTESIAGIPAQEVGRVVQDFIDDGATDVVVAKDEEGTYTVTRE